MSETNKLTYLSEYRHRQRQQRYDARPTLVRSWLADPDDPPTATAAKRVCVVGTVVAAVLGAVWLFK